MQNPVSTKNQGKGVWRHLVKITPKTSHSLIKLTHMHNQLALLYIQ